MDYLREHFHEWVPTDLTTDRLVLFDTEGDGLLRSTTKLHCIVLKDSLTGEVVSAHEETDLEIAMDILCEAPVIVAHNGIRHDVPVIQKLYGREFKGKTFDTLVILRLLYGDGDDFKAFDHNNIRRKKYEIPAQLIGRHSLEAWGYRLGVLKGEFSKNADWSTWTPAMQTYCEQDVEVLEAIVKHIFKVGFSPLAVALETAFAEAIHLQIEHGFPFDQQQARSLYAELSGERAELDKELHTVFPPKVVEEVFIPKVNNATRGYKKGVPFIKRKEVPFNPNSRQQVAERLEELYGWEPEEYTPTGQPKVDNDTLEALPYKEAQVLSKYFELSKFIGMVAEGNQGWLKVVAPSGRIHGEVNTCGTVTGRCTHSRPNLGQVPRQGELGLRCRECFVAPQGRFMVGADASGLELRMLGHFMARYDGGAYVDILLKGDIHTANQKAAGLPTRDNAKTFIYAFLYGAGDVKLGSIVAPHASLKEQARIGKLLRRRFLSRLPALNKLINTVKATAKQRKRTLYGIDKRLLKVRSLHSALNVVLQSAGSLLVKMATVLWHMKIAEAGYVFGKDWAQVAHVHDEVQAIARTEEIAEHLGKLFVESIETAGEFFTMRCETTGEYKIGKNWKETH